MGDLFFIFRWENKNIMKSESLTFNTYTPPGDLFFHWDNIMEPFKRHASIESPVHEFFKTGDEVEFTVEMEGKVSILLDYTASAIDR